ncbi:hypothetical protein TUN199_02279 [Pyrenophora tritici-repentis]|nr:hypothetical protein PtrV1_03883 [Pyrenophora tritici-repentis]KAI0588031.1 hypothetical protein Alg215_01143 [Pyrenophora tritici-repentis]KAI0591025.1 hypothetical protein Alg130_01656 [Pyrenophora tritici-repentis]KAI0614063.1 hypothetical protein TUN205_01668 [Pyrenophora tritici-repentis]KAI0625709.1 hypothetical protein TUN199_02279 [Pyrenophora tritici-repentis]
MSLLVPLSSALLISRSSQLSFSLSKPGASQGSSRCQALANAHDRRCPAIGSS